jgi:hypothetical protein
MLIRISGTFLFGSKLILHVYPMHPVIGAMANFCASVTHGVRRLRVKSPNTGNATKPTTDRYVVSCAKKVVSSNEHQS